MNQPPVTLVALCYNHARFLHDALESIRGQTYENVQVIVVDDSSTDDSAQRVRHWLDQRALDWRFVVHERNEGLCRTLNQALSLAIGKYIAFVATDDIWMPDKTARQVAIMESLPESVALVYSDAYLIDENGQMLPDTFIHWHTGRDGAPEGDLFLELLTAGNFLPAMTTLIRRSALEDVGGYDERLLYEDWDMWLRLSRGYRFTFDREMAASYRVLPNSLRTRALPIMQSDMQILLKWLPEPDLNPIVRKRIADLRWGLTQVEPERRWHHARLAIQGDPTLRSYAKLVLLLLGIRFEDASRLVPGRARKRPPLVPHVPFHLATSEHERR